MNKKALIVAVVALISINSFAQCWKEIDTKADTNRVILAIRDDHKSIHKCFCLRITKVIQFKLINQITDLEHSTL
jgi:hypothetical protein